MTVKKVTRMTMGTSPSDCLSYCVMCFEALLARSLVGGKHGFYGS